MAHRIGHGALRQNDPVFLADLAPGGLDPVQRQRVQRAAGGRGSPRRGRLCDRQGSPGSGGRRPGAMGQGIGRLCKRRLPGRFQRRVPVFAGRRIAEFEGRTAIRRQPVKRRERTAGNLRLDKFSGPVRAEAPVQYLIDIGVDIGRRFCVRLGRLRRRSRRPVLPVAQAGGIGLALAVCKRPVELLPGRLQQVVERRYRGAGACHAAAFSLRSGAMTRAPSASAAPA